MKTIIHVNQHVIRSNQKEGKTDPVLTCKTYKGNTYASRAEILGPDGSVVAVVRYEPNNPLSCGARVWIETNAEVRLDK